eukprot:1694354-Prymnesium_polylepis.1
MEKQQSHLSLPHGSLEHPGNGAGDRTRALPAGVGTACIRVGPQPGQASGHAGGRSSSDALHAPLQGAPMAPSCTAASN